MVQNLQRADGGDPNYDDVIPPASADLVVRSKGNVVLGFSDVVASGGLSNHDSRQMVDGEYTVYQVAVPPVATGAPVPSWKIHTDLRQGAVSLQIYKDPARPEGGIAVSGGDAIVVPPYLTAGETWYVRVKATGFTDYTIGSEQVKTEVPVWLMPDGLNQEFGDSGAELSGDRGVYLGNRQWHFYAIDVPEGNSGLLRTELQAISGNPDLYIREDGVPTLIHSAGGPSGSLYDRSLTASVTEYGNWVPSDRETRLRPGRWYLGVWAAGSSNARYRLLASTGVVKDMAIDGGGLELQSMADNDWRYYRFVVPWDAPRNWALTFRQQVGDVKLWIRDTVPPGQGRFNSGGSDIAAWDDDARNAGPYPSFDEPGTHVLTTPPLRPGQVYFAGFRSANSATFSVSSAVVGGTIGLPGLIPFYNGQMAGVLSPGASASFRIEVPAEATRFKVFGTHSSLVTWSVEQGTVASVAGPVHWRSSGVDPVLNVSLSPRSWPWAPGYMYYLTVTNASGSPTPFALRSDGRNALTEDEDNDGLPDSWEVRHFGSSGRYDGNGDPDADGNRNSVEWVDGTNPSDAGSARYFLNVKSVHGSVERSVLMPKYDKGTRVTLTPVADTGYFFSRWSGSTNSAVPVLALDVAGDLSLNAEFLPQAVAIVGQPVGGQWYFGDTVTLEVLATGQPVLGYQWKRDGVDLVSGPSLAGVTGPALVINPFDSAYSGAYTVVVSNAFNSVTSAVAVLSPPLGRTNVWLGRVSRDWFIPGNWSLNRVPGSLDIVRLSQGAVGVTTNSAFARLEIDGGTILGALRAPSGAVVHWTSGTLESDGSLTVEAGATLNMNGGSEKLLLGSLTNAGTVVWEGTGDLYLYGPPSYRGGIMNLPGATFEVRNDQRLLNQQGAPVFSNGGTFRKAGGSGTTRFSGVVLDSLGLVEVRSGGLNLSGGGLVGGEFAVADDSVLEMSGGTFRPTSGVTFSGGGLKRISGGAYGANVLGVPGRWALLGGDATLNGTIGSLDFGGGTLHGTSVVVGSMNWTSGGLGSDGVLTVESGATLKMSGGGGKTLMGSLTNAGMIVWEGTGDLYLYGPPSYRGGIVNLPGATFEVRNDQRLLNQQGAPVFSNGGTFRKTGGSGTTSFSEVGWVNAGAVEILSGKVASGSFEMTGGSLAFGIASPTVFGRMSLSGTAQLAGGLRTILLNGYQPANEAAFDVMTFASRSGGFTDLTDLKAGLGRHFEPIFTASGVSLQVRPSLTLAAVLPQTLNEETTLNVMLKGANADLPGQTLVYRLVAGPVGMTVSGAGLLAWTPTEAQGPSTNSVAVAVSDGFTSVTNRVEVTVVEVNQAPVLSAVSAQAVNEKTALSLTLQATDADVPAQALRYRLVDGPTGMTVSGAGLLAWTPTEAQGPSTNQVLVSVTDGVLTATNAFTLVVLDSTPPPVPEFGGLPVFESGKLRFAIRGAGRVRVETSADLVVWTAVEVLTVESGVLKEWVQAVGAEAFLAYRLVRE
jgi:hypothetical protein